VKPSELRPLTDEELVARIDELRGALFGLKIKHTTGQLESTANIRATRRDLARAMTIQRERSQSDG
jgi:large subunit ribosomal protein L29